MLKLKIGRESLNLIMSENVQIFNLSTVLWLFWPTISCDTFLEEYEFELADSSINRLNFMY
jgi:hypothetical protein